MIFLGFFYALTHFSPILECRSRYDPHYQPTRAQTRSAAHALGYHFERKWEDYTR